MSRVKVNNLEMLKGINILVGLANIKLPVKVSYAIKKNIEILSKELVPYEKEKAELISKYGDKDEEGIVRVKDNSYVIADITAFNNDIVELQNIENEIDVHYISLNTLFNCNIELSTAELTSISYILKED